MDGAEYDKRPVGAVPQPCQNHGDRQISRSLPRPVGAAAEGNVQVVAKPGAQTDMPTPPEILKAVRQERLLKIGHETKTQQLRTPTCHVAVAAEVSVHLPGERVGSDQHNPEVGLAKLTPERSIGQESTIVRDHAFPHQSRNNQHQAIEKLGGLECPSVLNLRKQLVRPLDRTRDQVREETYE